MSTKEAAAFLERVRADTGLQSQLGRNSSPEAFLKAGRSAGFAFTVAELRGAEHAERFFQRVSEDPALFQRLSKATNERAAAELARELGFECTVKDLQAVLLARRRELSETDLERVAGGVRFSILDVYKMPGPPAPFVPIPYPNW
jgi:predicted ribosomally synthesized peptide with nif11-like leader